MLTPSNLYALTLSIIRLLCDRGGWILPSNVHLESAAGWASNIFTTRLTIKAFHFKFSY